MGGEIRNRRSWAQLTRFGIPEFVVMRRITWQGASLERGQRFPKEETHHARLRQLYAAHLITPGVPVEAKPVASEAAPAKRSKKNG